MGVFCHCTGSLAIAKCVVSLNYKPGPEIIQPKFNLRKRTYWKESYVRFWSICLTLCHGASFVKNIATSIELLFNPETL